MEQQTTVGHGVDEGQLLSSLVNNNSFFLWMSRMAKSFKYLIPMLIAVLQVNTQDKNYESPFKSHPANMWIFLFSTFIYFFAAQLTGQPDNTIYFKRFIIVAAISGSLSAASLLSIFFWGSLGVFILIPWTFLPIFIAYQINSVSIHRAFGRLQQIIMNIISKFSSVSSCFNFNKNSSSVQSRLPV